MGGSGRELRGTARPAGARAAVGGKPGSYTVLSNGLERSCRVRRATGGRWPCTCPHYRGRGTYCGHIKAAEDIWVIRRLRGRRRAIIGVVDPIACRNGCALGVIWKWRRRRAGSTVQQYACREGGARFTANPGFEKLRIPR